jgi:hypothetical protein
MKSAMHFIGQAWRKTTFRGELTKKPQVSEFLCWSRKNIINLNRVCELKNMYDEQWTCSIAAVGEQFAETIKVRLRLNSPSE